MPKGGWWRYNASGTDLGTAWYGTSYDDSAWPQAPGELGYDEGDEATKLVVPGSPPAVPTTVYFRSKFYVNDSGSAITSQVGTALTSYYLSGRRDDGLVVYVNGFKVGSENMPAVVTYSTSATAAKEGSADVNITLTPPSGQTWLTILNNGWNTLAVEVHQYTPEAVKDISFDMHLSANAAASTATVPPRLSAVSETGAVLRWKTSGSHLGKVWVATSPSNLSSSFSTFTETGSNRTEHSMPLSGLSPDTWYYYAIGTSTTPLMTGADLKFKTAPSDPGYMATPTPPVLQFLVVGNVGGSVTTTAQRRSLDAYFNRSVDGLPTAYNPVYTHGVITLGDSAFGTTPGGTAADFQNNFLIPYRSLLSQTPVYPTVGDRDLATTLANQYYPTAFAIPGGGAPRYYSFNYRDIHFVSLDSTLTNATDRTNMINWLTSDLTTVGNQKTFTVAYLHHSPYSKGDKNSENGTEAQAVWVRQSVLDVLEANGVDLVLSGSSATYERSGLLDGARGSPATTVGSVNQLDNSYGPYVKPLAVRANQGTVYVNAGSSSVTASSPALDHPAMLIIGPSGARGINELGVVTLEAYEDRLTVAFRPNSSSGTSDTFDIVKRDALETTVTDSDTAVYVPQLNWTASSEGGSSPSTVSSYELQRWASGSGTFATIATPASTTTSYQDEGAPIDASIKYRLREIRGSSHSSWSNVTEITRTIPPVVLTIQPLGDLSEDVGMSWTAATGSVTSYEVERAINHTGVFSPLTTLASSVTYYVDNDVAMPETTATATAQSIQYRVRAVDGSTYSAWSNVRSLSRHVSTVIATPRPDSIEFATDHYVRDVHFSSNPAGPHLYFGMWSVPSSPPSGAKYINFREDEDGAPIPFGEVVYYAVEVHLPPQYEGLLLKPLPVVVPATINKHLSDVLFYPAWSASPMEYAGQSVVGRLTFITSTPGYYTSIREISHDEGASWSPPLGNSTNYEDFVQFDRSSWYKLDVKSSTGSWEVQLANPYSITPVSPAALSPTATWLPGTGVRINWTGNSTASGYVISGPGVTTLPFSSEGFVSSTPSPGLPTNSAMQFTAYLSWGDGIPEFQTVTYSVSMYGAYADSYSGSTTVNTGGVTPNISSITGGDSGTPFSITWNSYGSFAGSWRLLRSSNGTTYSEVSTLTPGSGDPSQQSAGDHPSSEGTYYYKIEHYSSGCPSSFSNVVSRTYSY